MDKAQAKLESLKMVKEWSAWLIGIQAAICTFLWNVLKGLEVKSWLDNSLYCGWLAFSLSLVIATLLISHLPAVIENLAESSSEGGVLTEQLSIGGIKVRLKALLAAQHMCFLGGVVFIVIHVVRQVLTKNAT
jgi:hypothetical protein